MNPYLLNAESFKQVIDALTEESHADIHSIVCVLHRKRIFHHKDYKKMMKILKSDRKYRCAKSVFSKVRMYTLF